ncbi:Polyisoprenoid-binding protein YceI [Flaviramulus basaltis]|uniref:Polyisoprenoid-binding protein YceI n=1 Tax=Flaviramulus basaltis TaxID=369401 RepID=A0A1K2INA7_9FLAO|nr:YceI family protein [Flaviramulus basaltis]SFZ93932.1 Polyisoprenoid-binding protein YceI [Flaviramulus basaltis]
MKKNLLSILFISAITVSIVSCKDKAKEADTTEAEEVVAVTPEAKFNVDLAASSIDWKGFKPAGSHNGTIKIESGVLNTIDGKISGGTFLIDMASIEVKDIPAEDEGNGKLVGHLTSPDFFDIEKHPNAAFEVTGLEEVEGKMMLSGNLALKDAKNNITFPVTVTQANDSITLVSETFTIDRTKWNVQYGSKSIFDNLGDKFINDDIELKIMLKAAKS